MKWTVSGSCYPNAKKLNDISQVANDRSCNQKSCFKKIIIQQIIRGQFPQIG